MQASRAFCKNSARVASSLMRISATAYCLVGYMRRLTGGMPGTSARRYCTVKS